MRASFSHQLDGLRVDLGRMCALAGMAARHATDVLLDADDDAALSVHADVDRLSTLHDAVEGNAIKLLALQAPVAGDLRSVVAAIRIAADVDRMGGLAAHVAELSLRHPRTGVVPAELRDIYAAMGRLAVDIAQQCQVAVLTGDCDQARRLCEADEDMETMHQAIHREVSSARWPHGAMVAAEMVLLGRFYGRFADHAKDIAHRVSFRTTGSHALL